MCCYVCGVYHIISYHIISYHIIVIITSRYYYYYYYELGCGFRDESSCDRHESLFVWHHHISAIIRPSCCPAV